MSRLFNGNTNGHIGIELRGVNSARWIALSEAKLLPPANDPGAPSIKSLSAAELSLLKASLRRDILGTTRSSTCRACGQDLVHQGANVWACRCGLRRGV